MKLRKPSIKTYSLNPATEACWLFATIICLGLGYIISASPFVKAADTTVTATIEPVLSMSLNTNAIDLNIIPSSTGTEEYGSVTLTVDTNNSTGYQLTMSSTSPNLIGSSANSIPTISGATSSSPLALDANTWGWYADSFGSFNQTYISLPDTGNELLVRQTNTNGLADRTIAYFGAKLNLSTPADTYSNTITFTAITNYVPQPTPIPEDIGMVDVYPTTGWAGDAIMITSNNQFNDVTGVTIGGTACESYGVISPSSIQCVLPAKAATNPSAGDGTENGYAVAVTTSTGTVDMHNFTVRYFNPSRTETIGSSATSNITMQDFTQSNCNAMTVGQVVSLTDSRNNQTYRIKKMQDNKCWMVDNLKYAGEANTDLANVDGTYGLVYNNDSGKFNTVNGTSTQSSTNSDKAFYNNPMSASHCYGTSIQSSYTKCGYLYNWYAATAGTGTYATSTRGTNVSGSICPTGWRLPSATSDGFTATGDGTSYTAADFAVLNASMNAGSLTTGSTTSYPTGWQFTGAWSGVFSGDWVYGFYSQGSSGYYWSSTASSSTNARSLLFNSSYVSPGNSDGNFKYNGFAIRCVLP